MAYIERQYKPCVDDGHSTWGDLCWDSPYSSGTGAAAQGSMVLSLNGVTTELIWDGGDHWRARDENGWRITRKTGASNGEEGGSGDQGEWWLVQTPDGSRYYFGYGAQNTTGADTHSVGVVPVFGDDSGEPSCSGTTENWCRQGYRWMVDNVVDVRENLTTYFYEGETNRYAIHGDTGRSAWYTRAMYPVRVDYGQQWGEATTTAPNRVEFSRRGRCTEATVTDDPLNDSQPSCPSQASSPGSFPDVPTDLICENTCRSDQSSPVFFGSYRLDDIQTFVWNPSTSAYSTVAQVQTRFGFPATDDGSDPSLWLDFLQTRAYMAEQNLTSTIVDFNGDNFKNRVDYNTSLGVLPMDMRRITSVENELGGTINVSYGATANRCPTTGTSGSGWGSWWSQVDGHWDHNEWDCYNVFHDPDGPGGQSAGFGVFHKYLVSQVDLVDNVAGSTTETWTYTYPGSPGWAYQDNMLYARGSGDQTWNQWRGYSAVTTQHGSGATTSTRYFRGMSGDYNADGSTKTVNLTDFRDETWQDYPSLAGQVLSTRTYEADGTEVASTASQYWSTTTVDGPGIHNAVMVRQSNAYDRERLVSAGTWREHDVDTSWTQAGLPDEVSDHGEPGVADNACTNTDYALNMDSTWGDWNYLELADEVFTYRGDCTSTTKFLTSRAQTFFDGATSVGTNLPSDGNPTTTRTYRTETAYVDAKATFDAYGRMTSATAPNQVGAATPKTTTWTYTPATGYPLDGVSVTNPAGQVTRTWPSRWHAGATKIQDVNGRYTHIAFDSFGRPTSVWLPTEGGTSSTPTGPASIKYTYPPSQTGPNHPTGPARVLSQTLQSISGSTGTYLKSYAYVDGFGRDREVQVPSPYQADTRIVSVTRYNNRGMVTGTSTPMYNAAVAGSGILNPEIADMPSYTATYYDTMDRLSATVQFGQGTEMWRTTNTYYGDRVKVDPPAGGDTVTYTDVYGRTTKIEEYTSATAHQDTTYAYPNTASDPQLRITDPAGKVTSFTSDLAGRRTQLVDPNAGTATYTYDNNANLLTATSPTGVITSTYDELDRPKTRSLTPPGGSPTQSATWTYDTAANGIGLLAGTTATTVASGQSLTVTSTVSGYDDRGRATGGTTALPTSASLGALSGLSYTTTATYDRADHLTAVAYPAVGGLPAETATVGYNSYGLPETLALTAGSTTTNVITDIGWSGSGLFDQRDFASGIKRNIDYDMVRRSPSGVKAFYTNTSGTNVYLQNDTYTRDLAGNITSITDAVQSPTQAQCFAYDARNRLTQAWTTNPNTTPCSSVPSDAATTWNTGASPYRVKWTHSTTNNLATANTATISGGTATWTNRAYAYTDTAHPNAHTAITPSTAATTGSDTFTYDTAGRMTSRKINTGATMSLGWDPASNLTSTTVGTAVTRYAYDADGQRILKITPTAVTAYLGATELTAPLPSGTATGTRHYTQGGSTVATRRGTAALTYLLGDLQGSASLTIGSGPPASATVSRQRYTPYGASRGTPNQLDLERGWLGQTEDDATGLTYLNARYYDPAAARFLSPDPLLNTAQPSTLNPYTYADNNPCTYADPSGLAKGGGPAYCGGNPSCIAAATNGGAASIDGQKVAKGVRKQVKKPGTGGQPRRYNGSGGGGGGNGSPGGTYTVRWAEEEVQIPLDTTLKDYSNYCASQANGSVYGCMNNILNPRLGPDPFKEFLRQVIIGDVVSCYNGSAGACAMIAMGFVPFGKAGRVIKAVHDIEAAGAAAKVARATDAGAGSVLRVSSEAALRAADNSGAIFIKNKHLSSSVGRWAKFDSADVSEVQGWVSEALRSEGAVFRPNSLADTFKVEVNMGRVVGTRGETGIRAIVTNDGRVINAFPFNAGGLP
jgi:RHS repeat-associated protein